MGIKFTKEFLDKANKLNNRISHLKRMKSDLRPDYCNGVGVCAERRKNNSHIYYSYHLWSTHKSNTEDSDLIMRVGIQAMYDEVCKLLKIAEEEFSNL